MGFKIINDEGQVIEAPESKTAFDGTDIEIVLYHGSPVSGGVPLYSASVPPDGWRVNDGLEVTNKRRITFQARDVDSTITHFAVKKGGVMICYDPLTAPLAVNRVVTPEFSPGDLTIHP